MRFLVFTFSFLLLQIAVHAQQPVVYQTTLAPSAMLGDAKFTSFKVSADGEYLMAGTNKEVRCWKMPEGELIYRYQAGRERKGETFSINSAVMNCTVVNSFAFIRNSTHLRIQGTSCGKAFMEIAALPDGELIKSGTVYSTAATAVPDNSTSNMTREAINQMAVFPSTLSSPVAKDCYKKQANSVYIYNTLAHPDEAGKQMIVYGEQFDCPEEHYKSRMQKEEYKSQVLWKDKPGYSPSHFKMYLGWVNIDGGEAKRTVQLGTDYWHAGSLDYFKGYLAPNGENAVITGTRLKGMNLPNAIYAFDKTGKALWQTPATADYEFFRFATYNNVWAIETGINEQSGKKAYVQFEMETGREIDRLYYPREHASHAFIPAWKLVALARNSELANAEKTSIISVHNAGNGGLVAVFTDPEAVNAFAGIYNKEQQRMKKEDEDREREKQRWAEQQRQWNLAAKERKRQADAAAAAKYATEYQPNADTRTTAASTEDKVWKTCPLCGGSGGEKRTRTTYSGAPRQVYNGFGGKTTFIDKSKPLYTDTKFEQCTRCWGKGKVKR